jgi:hydroxymethylbilane synthase
VKSSLRIATRESKLALWQAEHVAALLRRAHPQLSVSLVPMTTQGDRVQDRTLAQIGGKGLFIKELEVAIAEGRADIAVHSMKDVPSDMPPGMMLAAFLPRADARDAFVSNRYSTFASLPPKAKIGTSSLRRQCQLLAVRPDLDIGPLRGNVDTRLRKLDGGESDAIILACAGLIRLGFAARITEYINTTVSVPAVGQGIIGIECRDDDTDSIALLKALDDANARICCEAERAFAQRLGGSCQSPIAAHAVLNGSDVHLKGVIGSPDGKQVMRDESRGSAASVAKLGAELADRMLSAGARELLAPFRT